MDSAWSCRWIARLGSLALANLFDPTSGSETHNRNTGLLWVSVLTGVGGTVDRRTCGWLESEYLDPLLEREDLGEGE